MTELLQALHRGLAAEPRPACPHAVSDPVEGDVRRSFPALFACRSCVGLNPEGWALRCAICAVAHDAAVHGEDSLDPDDRCDDCGESLDNQSRSIGRLWVAEPVVIARPDRSTEQWPGIHVAPWQQRCFGCAALAAASKSRGGGPPDGA
jgi:hypothetical protein